MEGAARADVCSFHQTLFMVIRVIPDSADQHAPAHFSHMVAFVSSRAARIFGECAALLASDSSLKNACQDCTKRKPAVCMRYNTWKVNDPFSPDWRVDSCVSISLGSGCMPCGNGYIPTGSPGSFRAILAQHSPQSKTEKLTLKGYRVTEHKGGFPAWRKRSPARFSRDRLWNRK